MSHGISEDQYKNLLGSFSPDTGSVRQPMAGFNVTKEKKEQAKQFLMIAEQSLGERKPKKVQPDQSQPKQRKPARPVTGRVMESNRDMKRLLHESIEMVATGTSPAEMAKFLMEGEDSA